jgi:hypothetical protein
MQLFSALPINQWPFPFRESMKARERMLERVNHAVGVTSHKTRWSEV